MATVPVEISLPVRRQCFLDGEQSMQQLIELSLAVISIVDQERCMCNKRYPNVYKDPLALRSR